MNQLELSCRFDVRNLTMNQINIVLKFIDENKALILYENVLYEPSIENIQVIINSSKAKQWIVNPIKFLENTQIEKKNEHKNKT